MTHGPIAIIRGTKLAVAERTLKAAGFKPDRLMSNCRTWHRKVKGSVYETYVLWIDENNRVRETPTYYTLDRAAETAKVKAMLNRFRSK